MPRKRESAQLLPQLSAHGATWVATTKNTTILTRLFDIFQALWGCIQVTTFGAVVWLGCGGLEWIYRKAPALTVFALFVLLVALVSRELIHQWRD